MNGKSIIFLFSVLYYPLYFKYFFALGSKNPKGIFKYRKELINCVH